MSPRAPSQLSHPSSTLATTGSWRTRKSARTKGHKKSTKRGKTKKKKACFMIRCRGHAQGTENQQPVCTPPVKLRPESLPRKRTREARCAWGWLTGLLAPKLHPAGRQVLLVVTQTQTTSATTTPTTLALLPPRGIDMTSAWMG